MNWPVGNADQFRGVYDIQRQTLHLYEREAQGQYRAPVDVSAHRRSGRPRGDRRERLRAFPRVARRDPLGRHALRRRRVPGGPADACVLRERAHELRPRAVSAGAGRARAAAVGRGRAIRASSTRPTSALPGFVFKIQANMDPRHRDRVAFVRVCSGRFEKDMVLSNSRVGQAAAGVARVPVLRPRPRDHRRGLCGRHPRARQPGPVRHRRHGSYRAAAEVPGRAAVSRRSTSAACV